MVDYPKTLVEDLAALGDVVYALERRGVPIDLEVCSDIAQRAEADAAVSRTYLDEYIGTRLDRNPAKANWNYAAWLVEVLHGIRGQGLGLPPSPYCQKGKVKPGKVATDARALEYLCSMNPEHRAFLNRIRTYRRQNRVANYARTWMELAIPHPDGTTRLHPSFGMASDSDNRPGAKTGRFGIKNPPLQQVPRDKRKDPYGLRRAFVAPRGQTLLVADFSQLEVVIMAHLCVKLFGTRTLADRLVPGAPDMHSATAQYVFGQKLGQAGILECPVAGIKESKEWGRFRDLIKAIRYGLAYGKGAYGFGSTLFEVDANGEICGPALGDQKAQELIDGLLAFDPEVREFQEWAKAYAAKHKGMPSLAGRWASLPGIAGERWERERAERQAMNWPEQAGGQEITGRAMVNLHRAGFGMTLQIHDEIHVLVDEDKADAAVPRMKQLMETAWPLEAYLKAEPAYGPNWQDAK